MGPGTLMSKSCQTKFEISPPLYRELCRNFYVHLPIFPAGEFLAAKEVLPDEETPADKQVLAGKKVPADWGTLVQIKRGPG
jgi:hypothetical protein